MKLLIANLKNYLNKPFPLLTKVSHKLWVAFLFSAFIYFFLLIFEPFGISLVQYNKPIYVSGFFFITLFILLIAFILAPLTFKRFFDPDQFTVKNNLIFIFNIFISISVLNWWYNSLFTSVETPQHSFLRFLFITIAVGSIPTPFLLYFIENHLNQKNKRLAKSINTSLHRLDTANKTPMVKISSENKNEDLEIELSKLVAIKSEGNYIQVFHQIDGTVKNKLLRNSITNIEKSLSEHASIHRCHRSYIVNFDHVKNVTGNARNFNLQMDLLDFSIPVSRSFPKSLLNSLKD